MHYYDVSNNKGEPTVTVKLHVTTCMLNFSKKIETYERVSPPNFYVCQIPTESF